MVGQVWAVNSAGGFLYSDELSSDLRNAVQPLTKWRQFCDARDANDKGPGRGEVWHWDVIGNITSTGGTLVETNTMPESGFVMRQGTLTVQEYGNSVPFTQKLDNLSKFRVKAIVTGALKNDCKKTLDRAAYDQFDATPCRIVPDGGTSTDSIVLTTNGTATLTNSIALQTNHVKLIVDLMKERNVPQQAANDNGRIGGLAA